MFNAVQTLRELNAAPTPEAHNELLVMALQNLSQTPDLSHLATKDDLKDIIKDMATKTDIKEMATKTDIALVKAEFKVWIVGAAAVGSLGPSLVGLIAKAMHLS